MCICILSFSNKHFIESFWAFWRLQNSFIYFCVFISIPIFSCNIYLSKIISNRRFPEITGEIIWKSEAPAVGHHFRHRLLAYTGTWFQNEGGSRKALVCDSIRPSGMDLYYTGLPDARYALETRRIISQSNLHNQTKNKHNNNIYCRMYWRWV